jgi:lipoprotein-anchoring transpeptidase ErfK/SrfK
MVDRLLREGLTGTGMRFIGFAVFVITILFAGVACELVKAADAPSSSPTAVATASPTPRVATGVGFEPSTATPEPTATALPDRTSCAEVRGTEYHSANERQWYLANCLPTPTPTPVIPKPSPPGVPGPEFAGERWILIDIVSQTTTAMIGEQALYTALVTTGKDGWNTPTGSFRIIYRVANETMTSASIGAEEEYILKDVLYTQYFTNEGHALHLNYWRDDSYFGRTRSSHGCIGMRLADAEFFWNFAAYGTRVTIQ